MIVVLGRAVIRDGCMPEAQALCQQHVSRSRTEPGCVEHGYCVDGERPNRLVFVERWLSLEHLQAHRAVTKSRMFARELRRLASAPPAMEFLLCSPVPRNRIIDPG
jgi:quinol monooxygenase YgiN